MGKPLARTRHWRYSVESYLEPDLSGVDPTTTVKDAVTRSGRKPKGEGHSRRAEILAAAERIFVEYGYEGATIRKIADEVGLSSTALYMHFPDKGAILQEICRDVFEELLTVNRRIGEVHHEPGVRLREMMAAYVAFGFNHPNAYRLVYMTQPVEARDGVETAAQKLGAALFQSFESAMQDLAAKNGLRSGDAAQAARVFWTGVHGIVSLMLTKPHFDWGDRQALSETMIETLFTGLVKSPSQ